MKYPVLIKRCNNQHNNLPATDSCADCFMCGACRRAYDKLKEDFEAKYEEVLAKERCIRCHGTGHYSSKYGMKACDDCNTKGFTWVKKWKHKKQLARSEERR